MIQYSILLPTYNERKNLPLLVNLIARTFAQHPELSFEIIVVDDSSPDGTADVVRELQRVYNTSAETETLRLFVRPDKMGLGSAYRDGVQYCKGEWTIIMDGDFSHHPQFILKFIEKQAETGADIVSGTRYMPGGGVYGWDLKRKLISRGANMLASMTLGLPASVVSDCTGSFRLYKTNILRDVLLPLSQSAGYVFQLEIIYLAYKNGFKIAQVPITFVDRVFGESKLGASEVGGFVNGLWMLVKS